MKISFNQLKRYVEIDISPDETAEILTDIGLEVEHTETIGTEVAQLKNLVVGEVVQCEPHPNADRLKLASVVIGNDAPISIVCGAPNIAVHQKVVVALPGTQLFPFNAPPFTIKKSKIRGIESHGMICAEDEIGLSDFHDGIIVLNNEAQPGRSVVEYLSLQNDTIFEIGLTANRSDATGHIGVARDLSAALSVRKAKQYSLNYPEIQLVNLPLAKQKIDVQIANENLCPRYSGVLLENIKVLPSPQWLQNLLASLGFRSINNIVDITNLILLEYGQPLHAFDADKISDRKILVQTLENKSDFIGLDEAVHELNTTDLMICDPQKPLCIAGVFGGLASRITESTQNIFIESACFNAISIRKTASRLNLRTDAAQRYEKGTDPQFTMPALLRAIHLMQKYAHAQASSEIIDIHPATLKPYSVSLQYEKLNKISGIDFEKNVVTQILNHLEIKIESENEDSWQLQVPLFKADVQREIDVVEEIMRIYGLNQVPVSKTFVIHPQTNTNSNSNFSKKEKIANYLAHNGWHQMINNSIVSKHYETLGFNSQNKVHLLKSAQSDLNELRSDMLISGLETIRHNINRKQTDLKLFEFGKTYAQNGSSSYQEKEHLSMFITGKQIADYWNQKTTLADIFYLKGTVLQIFKLLQLDNEKIEALSAQNLGDSFSVFIQNKNLASMGRVKSHLLQNMDIDIPVFFADIDIDELNQLTREAKPVFYKEISKYPGIRRDLALLIENEITYQQIKEIAVNKSGKLLKNINLFDNYVDNKLGENKKSYAISFWFEDENRTLKDQEIDEIMQQLTLQYQTVLGAEIR